MKAVAYVAKDQTDSALEELVKGIELGRSGKFLRFFIDEGPQLVRLIYEAAARGIALEYTERILAACPASEPGQENPPILKGEMESSFEALSERELDVLRRIGDRLSNQDIGERLFISTHTVKAYSRNIYAKIDAHSRTEALAKARAFGLM
jgi:LuxR family maltose regulon positive regulatory protein